MKMFIVGFFSALLLVVLVCGATLLWFTQMPRANAAVIIIDVYEHAIGNDAPEVVTPFEDIGGLSPKEQSSISKLYGLGITAGTSAIKFSPNDRTQLYQWLIFVGKLIMRIG
jgi:hypothetical protein